MPRRRQQKAKQRIGQAAVLSGTLWKAWCQHLLRTSSTWLFVAVTLSQMLCARISEVLALRSSDFHWKNKTVTIKALKRQPLA